LTKIASILKDGEPCIMQFVSIKGISLKENCDFATVVATNFQLHATHATTRPHSCMHKISYTRLTVTYNSMYADNICGMNLYFIHLYYSTRVTHGCEG
jgi:hypothetical protein